MRVDELVPLWAGRSTGLPVFCLPHAGGGASAYRGIARGAPPGISLQPVQLPGRETLARLPLCDDVPHLVELLGAALRPLLDEPYALAGHGMGALLAAELTAWLERHRAPAPRLLVVSSCGGDLRPDAMPTGDLGDARLLTELAGLGRTAPEVPRDPETRAHLLEVLRNDLRLVRRYRSGYDRLAVPVLALGGDRDPAVSGAALAEWRHRTSGDCRVELLPGGHFVLHEQTAAAGALIAHRLRSVAQPFDALPAADRALLPAGLADAFPASAEQSALLGGRGGAGRPGLGQDLVGVHVEAPFDEVRFRAALRTVMARHDPLRSSFGTAGFSAPVQLVRAEADPPLDVESGDGAALVRAFHRRRLTAGADLSEAPAFRCHVVREPESFSVSVAAHHAVLDRWSVWILLAELITVYEAELRGVPAELPAVPPDGHRRLVEPEYADPVSAAFWLAEANAPPLLLPLRAADAVPDPVEARFVPLDEPAVGRIRAAAEEAGVPPKSLFVALHVWSLVQATGRDTDVVTGLVTDCRPAEAGSDHLVGRFVKTLPLRLRTTRGSWADQARRAWSAEQDAAAHRHFPLAEIERRLRRAPFDVTFGFTQFRPHHRLEHLGTPVGSWWSVSRSSIPLGVDVLLGSPDLGSGVLVAFDPGLVKAPVVDEYIQSFTFALLCVANSLPFVMRTFPGG
ncbi:thioesterase domain-containing protein [Kitasatospora sp. KL5]|uniref:thioesterase domain-containing protein n=1 Tax=Kitasatospora sp. KL5 TaxID=3425125 RepID=UPI003D6EBAC3